MELPEPCHRSVPRAWLGALLLVSAGDRSYRLNEPFPLIPGGDVGAVELSADGAWIVYVADAGANDVEQLYSAPADGSDVPRAIAADGGASGIFSVTLTPDGTRVLYSTTLQTVRSLYGVPIDGSAPPVLLVGPHVTGFQITPDSSRVVFIGDIVTDDRFLLCSMPVDGGAGAIVLNGSLTAGGDVEEFAIAPDGARVVYLADANVDGRLELFSAPVNAGGGAIRLNPPLGTGRQVDAFRISPDGTRVVYRADQANDNILELYAVPIDGSAAPVRLNTPLPFAGGQDVEADFVLSPDGSRVVYRSDETSNNVVQLYSVPIDASTAPTLLTPGPVAGGDVEPGPLVSPDGALVVFRADLSTDETVELFSVPIDGSGAAVRLSGVLAVGAAVLAEFRIAPDGSRVAFLTGSGAGATLHGAPIDGSAAPIALDSDPQYLLSELTIGSNGVRVLYRKPDAAGSHLWSARLDGGGAALQLSGGEALGPFRMTPNGAGVLYVADEDVHSVAELFARPAGGTAPPLQINPEFPDNVVSGSVSDFVIAGQRAVFVADADESDVRGLYSVPISRRTPPIRISATSGTPLHVFPFLFEPLKIGAGGTRAVFLATAGIHGANRELYSAPLDGSSQPARLNAPVQALGNVTAFRLSGDGARVVYLADQDSDEVFELYRAEVDGSGSPVKLSGTMVSGGDVLDGYDTGFQVDADGSHAFFTADGETDNVVELFSGDGVSAPIKLSGPIVAQYGGVQVDVQLSADGAWVFYRADANLNNFMELYRAPSDGSSGAVKLSGSGLSSSGVQDGFRVTPDGARVLFRAYAAASGNRDLFTVPADASSPPLRLNSAPGAWYSGVSELELAPSGTRAVFRYDPDNDRLYSVPVDGSGPDVMLTPLSGNQHVLEDRWAISPDGARVVYVLFTVGGGAVLRSVPIGGGPPVLLGGNPYLFEIDPTSRRVAYVDSVSSYRLFLVPIDGSSAPLPLTAARAASPAFTADGAALLFRLNARQSSYDLHAALLEKAPRSAGDPGATVVR